LPLPIESAINQNWLYPQENQLKQQLLRQQSTDIGTISAKPENTANIKENLTPKIVKQINKIKATKKTKNTCPRKYPPKQN